MIAKKKQRCLEDVRASTVDVGDLVLRMPNKEQNGMVELVNQLFIKDVPYMLLLDEFRHAEPSIRRMFYQIILDRKLGSYKLPDKMCILALSNPTDEVDTEELETPLMDRFDIKVKIRFDFDEWKEWAYENGIHSDVVSFLQHFNEFTHTNVGSNGQMIPVTPRTWERVSNHMDKVDYILPAEVSIPFKEFMEKVQFFKHIDSYLEGKEELPEEVDMQYAFASAVMGKIGNDMNDSIVGAWFVNNKVNGLREEVHVFMDYAVMNTHKAKTGKKKLGEYVLGLPPDTKKAIVTRFKELGYLFDSKI
jgi:hypothetical protein